MELNNQKKNKILIAFLSLLILILMSYIAYDKLFSNNNNKNNNEQVDKNINNEENVSDITFGEEYTNKEVSINEENEQLLDKLVGDWGNSYGLKGNGLNIVKDTNGRFYYMHYQYGGGGFRFALILQVDKLSDNKYELTEYYPATSGDSIYGENPEKEEKLIIDTSKLSSNIIIANNHEYEKITTTSEEFYNSKLAQETERLDKIIGDWGRCEGTLCNGIEIRKEKNFYYYMFYVPNAGGFREARFLYTPTNIEKNKYEVTGYYSATSGDSIYGENLEKEEELIIDTSKISSNIIIVNNIEYEKITGNREQFYNSKQN